MKCTETVRTGALLAGQLDPETADEAARHIAECVACQEQVAAAEALGGFKAKATYHRAPDALRQQISRVLDRKEARMRREIPRSFWLGAGSGVGVSALAAAIVLAFLMPPVDSALVGVLVDAHTRALMEARTVSVVSSSHHTVKPWFAGRVALSPPVADFALQGFPLSGGRIDSLGGVPAAVVVYRHGAHEIDLFVWADRGTPIPEGGNRLGYRTILWKKADLDFAAVSDMERSELEKFVALVKAEPE